jgi:hypothetical protein
MHPTAATASCDLLIHLFQLKPLQEVQEVSRRLLQLQQLLGQEVGDEQLVFAVQREPGLLTASLPQLQRRLIELRVR